MNEILLPVAIVAGIGLLAGLGLAVASIVMAVPKDEKAEAVLELLPGANCGACGYSGCSGYAKALAHGEAKPGLCSPGGAAVAQAVSEVLGVSGEVELQAAVVRCVGGCAAAPRTVAYEGMQTCAAAALTAGGLSGCRYGCLGFGDCARVCEYGAISLKDGLAAVDPARCKGCSLCVKACPKGLIRLTPLKEQAAVQCSSRDKGAATVKACQTGCIGCGKCVRACPRGAIRVEDFHAAVDPAQCTACGACVSACPRGCITLFTASPRG